MSRILPTDQEALDLAARAAHGARAQSQRAINLLQAQERVDASGYTARTLAAVRQAEDHAVAALGALLGLGAARPGGDIARDRLPLELLDTPASRRLLAVLGEALDAARVVDEERGWVDPDSGPCGLSEAIGGMVVELRREVEGARGRE